MSDVQLGQYRHYKGRDYRVLAVAKHSETLEEMVVYEALYDDHQIWVRPKCMFLEMIEWQGRQVPRFVNVDQHSATIPTPSVRT